MKLLILTQKVDQADPVLGFFCRWIEKFANYCEKLAVICLVKGKSPLPSGVTFFSLGKKAGQTYSGINKLWLRIRVVVNFYKHIWRERKNYDAVFVHMNQEYVLLGSWLWKMLGKKIFLWRNHPQGGFLTRLAVKMADLVFCTSPHSYTARFTKTKIMPVGIDVDLFKRDATISRKNNSILFFGRLSPIKKPDILLESLHLLRGQGLDFSAALIGDAIPASYKKTLIDLVARYGLQEKISFGAGVDLSQAPEIYNNYEIFVNLTPTGSMDKTIFEAMACENIVITTNQSLSPLNDISHHLLAKEGDVRGLGEQIRYWLEANAEEKAQVGESLRRYVVDTHNLDKTIAQIINYVS